MTYAARADLPLSDQTLAQLTGTTGLLMLEKVTPALEAADAQILSYLHQRFGALPPDPVGLLQGAAVSLAVYWLYQHAESVLEIPAPIAGARKEALDWLREVRDNKAGIGAGDDAAAGAAEGAHVTVSAPARHFDRDLLDKY